MIVKVNSVQQIVHVLHIVMKMFVILFVHVMTIVIVNSNSVQQIVDV